jgi:hypothetical protein
LQPQLVTNQSIGDMLRSCCTHAALMLRSFPVRRQQASSIIAAAGGQGYGAPGNSPAVRHSSP